MPIRLVSSPPPHLRAGGSIPQIMWLVVLALVPALLASFIFFGFDSFRVSVVATASTSLSEEALRKLFRRKSTLYDGSAVVTGILLALMLPATVPSWMVALGSFFAIGLGKEIFGGLGTNLFNPALVGLAFLWSAFPQPMSLLMVPFDAVGSAIRALAILTGGTILLAARLIHWEIPLLYLASVSLFSLALGRDPAVAILSGGVFLAAFFMVTDPVTTPVTRSGERWFALGSGFLTVVIREATTYPEGVTYGILLMNALVPWMDRWIRPRPEKMGKKRHPPPIDR